MQAVSPGNSTQSVHVDQQYAGRFQLDVRNLGMKQSLRLSDIAIPDGVKPLAHLGEVAVVIAKR